MRARKTYKLSDQARPVKRKKHRVAAEVEDEESVRVELEMSILGLIALKGAA